MQQQKTDEVDITQLPKLINQIEDLSPEEIPNFITTIHSLIISPFEIGRLLPTQKFNTLSKFLVENIGNETAVRCLAILISKTTNPNQYIANYKIVNEKVGEVDFFSFLTTFAKFAKITSFKFEINKNDPIFVKKQKMKIIASQAEKKFFEEENAIREILANLQSENFSIEFSMSKALWRVLRCVDYKKMLPRMTENLREILADEIVWIVYSNVFSFFLLEHNQIADLDRIYKTMIFFDKKSSLRSEDVRHHGLFLLRNIVKNLTTKSWKDVNLHLKYDNENDCVVFGKKMHFSEIGNTFANQNVDLSEHVKFAILVALFDSSLQCRRAAVALLREIDGIQKIENSERLFQIVDFQSVKRYGKKILVEISKLFRMKQLIIATLKNGMFHYNAEKRLADAETLREFGGLKAVTMDEVSDGLVDGFFMESFFRFVNCDCKFGKFEDTLEFLKTFVVDKFVLQFPNRDGIMREYLKMYGLVSVKSLGFIMERNVPFDDYHLVCRALLGQGIGNYLFKNLKEKESGCFILGNAFNSKFKDEISQIFSGILQGNNYSKILGVLRVILITEEFEKYSVYLSRGLENYSVDETGDVGAAVRLECFNMIGTVDLGLFERYFFRYFGDKSKKIRDAIHFHACGNPFGLICKSEHFKIGECAEKSEKVKKFVDCYKGSLANYLKEEEKSASECHFRALVENIGAVEGEYQNEVIIGLIKSMMCADASEFYLLLELLYSQAPKILAMMENEIKGVTKNFPLLVFIINQFLFVENDVYKGLCGAKKWFLGNDNVKLFAEKGTLFKKGGRVEAVCKRILGTEDTNLF